jgi:hypothetical protein
MPEAWKFSSQQPNASNQNRKRFTHKKIKKLTSEKKKKKGGIDEFQYGRNRSPL